MTMNMTKRYIDKQQQRYVPHTWQNFDVIDAKSKTNDGSRAILGKYFIHNHWLAEETIGWWKKQFYI